MQATPTGAPIGFSAFTWPPPFPSQQSQASLPIKAEPASRAHTKPRTKQSQSQSQSSSLASPFTKPTPRIPSRTTSSSPNVTPNRQVATGTTGVVAGTKKRKRNKSTATSFVLGDETIPAARRTKYVKLLEAMTLELAAVRQQLYLTNKRLKLHEPEEDDKADSGNPSTSSSSATSPSGYGSGSGSTSPSVSFDSLLPQTRQIIFLSQADTSLHHATFVHAPMMIWKMDLRRHVLDANIAFCETHGWTISEIAGRLLPPGNPTKPMYPPSIKFPDGGVASLTNGLPSGLTVLDLLPSMDVIKSVSQLYTQQEHVVICTYRQLNAKGELCESRVISWLVYEDGSSYPSLDVLNSLSHSSSSSSSSSSPSSSSTCNSPRSASPWYPPELATLTPSRSYSDPVRECESMLYSFYSSLSSSHGTNPFLQQLLEWATPPLVRCYSHPQVDIGEMISATFACKRPIYVMNVCIPADHTVIRHPESPYPSAET